MPARCLAQCSGYFRDVPLDVINIEAWATAVLAESIQRDELVVSIIDPAGAAAGRLILGPLSPREDGAPSGRWCLHFTGPNQSKHSCLADGRGSDEKYWWHVFVGGEIEVLESCAVELSAAIDAIGRCCSCVGRAEELRWIDTATAFHLDA